MEYFPRLFEFERGLRFLARAIVAVFGPRDGYRGHLPGFPPSLTFKHGKDLASRSMRSAARKFSPCL